MYKSQMGTNDNKTNSKNTIKFMANLRCLFFLKYDTILSSVKEGFYLKYFVISDIHSHYEAMITALEKHKYDEHNPNHHLLVLGDLFDRGKEAILVLEYLFRLNLEEKATIILGNHDTFLLDFLQGKQDRSYFNIIRNGFGETLQQLSGIEALYENFKQINNNIIYNYSFLENCRTGVFR